VRRPSDDLAGRWASRLRTMGVTVAEGCELTACRGLLFSLTPADVQDGERLELLRQGRAKNLPMVVVKSPDLELAEADRRLLDGAKVITAQRHASVEVWLQVLHGLHALKAIASDPDDDLSTTEVSNEFRKVPESRPEWRVAAMATLVVALACLAWWVFLKRSQQEDLRGQLGQPLLPAQPEPTPKAVPIAPPAPGPASSAATATPASLALQAEARLSGRGAGAGLCAGERSRRRLHQRSDRAHCLLSHRSGLHRWQGRALPRVIEGQPHGAPGSSGRDWHRNIGFIKVDDEPLADPATLVVVVRSSFFAENRKRQDSTSGAVVTRYTVRFAPAEAVDQPGRRGSAAVRVFASWDS